MKLLSVIALAATLCQNFASADLVSVQGDGTYDIKGPVCSGPGTMSTPAGSTCPQIGDTAVDDCHPYHPSDDAKSGTCVAPVPALCKHVKTGVWGCVWDLSSLEPALGEVKVVDDTRVFKIKDPVCGGPAAAQTGKACPVVGDVAVSGCVPTNPSYNATSGKCVAPVPALCQPTQNDTVWGCVWDLSSVTTTTTKTLAAATSTDESSNGGSSAGLLVGSFVGVAAVIAVVAAVVAGKRKSKTSQTGASGANSSVLEVSPQTTTSQSFRQV